MPPNTPASSGTGDADAHPAYGRWSLQVETPIGTKATQLELHRAQPGGWMLDLFGRPMALADVVVGDGHVAWRLEVSDPMPLTLRFAATVDGDRMHGSIQWAMPAMRFSGVREDTAQP